MSQIMNYCYQGGIILCELSLRQRTSAQPFTKTKRCISWPKKLLQFSKCPFKTVVILARNKIAFFCRGQFRPDYLPARKMTNNYATCALCVVRNDRCSKCDHSLVKI